MEHDVHRFAPGRNPEAGGWTLIDFVGDTSLGGAELNLEVESPESDASFGMKPYTGNLSYLA